MTPVEPHISKAFSNPSSTIAVEARHLVRRFGSVTALDSIDLKVREGEFFSLLGPSGCGKTTLLRIIAGLETTDSGELFLNGQKARDIPPHRRPVNTVFQNYALFPHLTIWDNVAFGLRMKKVPHGDIKSRVEKVLELVEIKDLSERKPHQISGGQKQRVALARAVVNEPKVLLLDEPLGALDLKLRKQLQIQLHQLQRRLGITFIYVTHDQEEALVMSDRIAVMNAGRIEQLDSSESIYEFPKTRFVAEFLGSCNLISGDVIDQTVQATFGVVRVGDLSKIESPKVTLAIRPEKLLLQKIGMTCGSAVNRYQGRVEDKVYSGAETQYRIRVDTQLFVATHLNSRAHSDFAIGEPLHVQLPESSLIALED